MKDEQSLIEKHQEKINLLIEENEYLLHWLKSLHNGSKKALELIPPPELIENTIDVLKKIGVVPVH